MTEKKRGFGRRNQHCMNCGDERGGPVGHETQECLYVSGMSAGELSQTMPPDKQTRFWDHVLTEYFNENLKGDNGGESR